MYMLDTPFLIDIASLEQIHNFIIVPDFKE